MGSKLSFLRSPNSLSQPASFPPEEDQAGLIITHQVEQQQQEEEVVNDSPSVSDDQTTMRTPCVRKPTPMKNTTTTRLQPPQPQPHCSSSYPDRGSDACEAMDVVVLPYQPAGKPTSAKRRLSPEFEKNADEEAREKKMKTGNRLWSEEDEVLILRGLMDFQKKKGAEAEADPCRDVGEIHELIRESLSVDASDNQLLDKIRKLRRKYTKNNVAKGGKGGLLSSPHERECFELSKRIWRIDGGGGGGGGGGGALGEKAEELEEKWRIWRADEVALRLRHDELIEEQKKLMLDVVRASKE